MIDWLQALGQQDQSLEAMLARRDMTKHLKLLTDLAAEKAQREQFAQRQSLDERQLEEQTNYRKSVQEATAQERAAAAERARIDDERQQYQAIIQRLKPGMNITQAEMPIMEKFGQAGQFEADPNDPLRFVYMRQEGERLAAKAKQDEELELERERRAEEAAKRDQERLRLAQQEEERRQQREQRAAKAFEQKQKQLDTRAQNWPPHMRAKAAAKAKRAADGVSSGFFEDKADLARKQQLAIEQVYDEIDAEVRALTHQPPALPKPPGEGGQEDADARFRRLMERAQAKR